METDVQTPRPWDKLQATIPHQDELFPQSVESRLNAATDWLASCLKEFDANHSNCIENINKQMTIPGRLLDLETGLINPTIRLVKPVSDFTTPYMTLSHRWGNQHPCKTTKGNLSERFREIKMTELPMTFQHAVIITRTLGVRFLWIDSPCIVQDNPEDWEIEASKMAFICAGSYLTIAAISSLNCSGGCIAEYPTSAYHRINARNVEHGSVYVRQDQCDVDISDAHLDITGGNVPWGIPLLSRAWVYQERLLSPRVAHFPQKGDILGIQDDMTLVRPTLEQISQGNLLNTWEDIISTYSQLLLTYPKDKLPALAGIASMFSQHVNGSDYLAGIWEALLPDSLFWHTSPVEPWLPETLKEEYQAPSWSWAAGDPNKELSKILLT
ncbi:heterokaryon incompatibility protein-domain-containing protein [Xylogone sp. PMI_703]|nr:heterokaryon incompatibility protein-domain-containing protein [Xylogone sp. PMI_703]